MLHLGRVIGRHGIKIHCYADKTQLYLKVTSTSSPSSSVSQLHSCLEETKAGMKGNFLQRISSKTEAIQIGTPHQRRSSMISAVSFLGHYLSLFVSVTNLRVRFDPHQSFDSHINHICSTFFFHLRKSPNCSHLSPVMLLRSSYMPLSPPGGTIVMCSSSGSLAKAVKGSNMFKTVNISRRGKRSRRGTSTRRKHEHITLILHALHSLPVHLGIEFKILLHTHHCLHGAAHTYLTELLTSQPEPSQANCTFYTCPGLSLRLWATGLVRLLLPRLWSAFPDQLRAAQTMDAFEKGLKTFTDWFLFDWFYLILLIFPDSLVYCALCDLPTNGKCMQFYPYSY